MDGKGWRFSAKNFLIIVILLSAIIALPKTASAAQLTLTWKDSSNNEDGFEVERKTGTTGSFAVIATKGPNTTSHIDANLASGITYCYRVLAFNAAGDSAYSNEACGTTPSSQTFTLTVTKTGSGNGTVTSSPAGINCGSTCSATYTSSTTVTLTATPATGSTFTGWSGGCSGTGNCTVITNANVTITATFTTASSSPTPNPTGLLAAYSFNEGRGNTVADGSGNNRTGTISGATWTSAGKYNAALSFDGVDDAVDVGSVKLPVEFTTMFWFQSTEQRNYRSFLGDYDAKSGAAGWTIRRPTSNRLAFSAATACGIKQVTLSKSTTAFNGAWHFVAVVVRGHQVEWFYDGQTEIASLGGNCPVKDAPGALKIGATKDGSAPIKAIIDEVRIYDRALTVSEMQTAMTTPIGTTTSSAPQTYTLSVTKAGTGSGSVSSNPAGISCGSTCSATYPSGTTVTLTAAPASGSTFTGWSGGCSGTGNCTVITNANVTITATFTTASSSPTPSPTGLMAAYGFKEGSGNTVADASGNNNTGTISGATWTSAGKYGSALSFNGSSSYVQAPHSPSLNISGNTLTLSAWVTTTTTSGSRIIVGKPVQANTHAAPYFAYTLHMLNGGTPRFCVTVGGSLRCVAASQNLLPNTWTHIAGVYDGTALRIYLDGVQRGTLALSGNLNTYTTPLRIGTNGGLSEVWSGRIDEVRIYQRALTTSELQTAMTSPLSSP
jgi:hypothetical protein